MARSILLLVLATSALHAASTVFSSCTAGSIAISPCSTDSNLITGLAGPDYFVAAYAAVTEFSATNLPLFGGTPDISGGHGVSAEADAAAVALDSSAPPLSATAQASDTVAYASVGVPRSGTIEFDIGLGYLHEDAPGVVGVTITDGTHTYTYTGGGGIFGSTAPIHCGIEDCEYTAALLFLLGTTFQVSIAANAAAAGSSSPKGRDGLAQVVFNIFDANGAPVAFAAVPEPSMCGWLGLAVLSAGWFVRGRRLR
jgi:hypothetical protein